jgi:phage repressor protein C with HTH and peptisase S24 domain
MADIPVTERLKALRNRAGVTMAEAAQALGKKTPSGYQHYEDPKKFSRPYLPHEIIEKLIPLFVGHGEPPVTEEEAWNLGGQRRKGDYPSITPIRRPAPGRLVPIYSAAQGGEGHLIIDHTLIDELPPPEELLYVRDPYGILIVGESMVPAYRPGDIAWVNPHKLPERDTDVVLYHVPPHGEAEAIIKTLVSWSPQEWKLRQYQPPLDFTESIIDWPICHRIVGKKNVR